MAVFDMVSVERRFERPEIAVKPAKTILNPGQHVPIRTFRVTLLDQRDASLKRRDLTMRCQLAAPEENQEYERRVERSRSRIENQR